MIRVLIVDDERPARAKLRKLLEAESDIQMPRLDGFGVIEAVGVGAMPAVVFVTAYDEHALRAFEVNALDYLLKPYAPSRFVRLLDRVRRWRTQTEAGTLSAQLQDLLALHTGSLRYLERLVVEKSKEREVLLRLERVDLIRAEGNYLSFIVDGGVYTRRGTLAALVERLDPKQFMRINRSEIVRLDAVQELQSWSHGDYRVIMRNGSTLTWSRRYRARAGDEF